MLHSFLFSDEGWIQQFIIINLLCLRGRMSIRSIKLNVFLSIRISDSDVSQRTKLIRLADVFPSAAFLLTDLMASFFVATKRTINAIFSF